MPAETSIGLSTDTKERLEKHYRSKGHASMDEVIQGLMEIVPPAEDIIADDACSWPECDKPLILEAAPEDQSGVIRWWATERGDSTLYGNAYYCSIEHAHADAERIEEMSATHPDAVVLGGDELMEVYIETPGLRLFHPNEHEDRREVGIDVPLDLEDGEGEDVISYVGEPIEIENAGKVRFSGTIDEIVREEVHTAIYF